MPHRDAVPRPPRSDGPLCSRLPSRRRRLPSKPRSARASRISPLELDREREQQHQGKRRATYDDVQERRRVERFQQASSHGRPQSFVRVEVILYEGTDREKRNTYHGVLFKTGQVVHVKTFKISR